MKILSLSLDKKILEKDSSVARRMFEFTRITDRYDIFIPARIRHVLQLHKKISVFASGGGNKLSQFLFLFLRAKKQLQKQKYDCFTSQDPFFLGFLAYLLHLLTKVPFEVQIHGWNEVGFLRRVLRNFVIKKASGVRVVSFRMKKQVMEIGISEEKIINVPVYSEVDMFSGTKETRKKKIFLSVSRLVKVKNIEMQIDAFASLESDAELWIVGDGSEREALEAKVKELKLAEKVKFLGWKEKKELDEIYKKAFCLLLTSDSEGWGRVVIEAGAFGVPSIMTDVGLAGEVIQNEENGMIIPVGDAHALKNAIDRVMIEESFYTKLSKNIKKTVECLPDLESTLELYLEGWKKII